MLVAEAVAAALGGPKGTLDVLDAGCGTGWCGPHVRPYARRLTGVDLSPAMIERAEARRVYDELVVAELTEYLAETTEEPARANVPPAIPTRAHALRGDELAGRSASRPDTAAERPSSAFPRGAWERGDGAGNEEVRAGST